MSNIAAAIAAIAAIAAPLAISGFHHVAESFPVILHALGG